MVSGVPYKANVLASHNVVIIWNEVAQGTGFMKNTSWACQGRISDSTKKVYPHYNLSPHVGSILSLCLVPKLLSPRFLGLCLGHSSRPESRGPVMSLLGPEGAWAELQRHVGQAEWSGSQKARCLVPPTVC